MRKQKQNKNNSITKVPPQSLVQLAHLEWSQHLNAGIRGEKNPSSKTKIPLHSMVLAWWIHLEWTWRLNACNRNERKPPHQFCPVHPLDKRCVNAAIGSDRRPCFNTIWSIPSIGQEMRESRYRKWEKTLLQHNLVHSHPLDKRWMKAGSRGERKSCFNTTSKGKFHSLARFRRGLSSCPSRGERKG